MPQPVELLQRQALCRATSSQIGWPLGANAECGSASPKRLAHDLRRGGRAQELAAAARRGARRAAGAAASSSVISPCAYRAPIVWTLPASSPSIGGSVTPPGTRTQGSRVSRQRHHHRRQSLVARRHAQHAAPRRQRADQSPQHGRRIVAIRQAVEHARRALRATVARIGNIRGKRARPPRCLITSAAACTSSPTSQCPV